MNYSPKWTLSPHGDFISTRIVDSPHPIYCPRSPDSFQVQVLVEAEIEKCHWYVSYWILFSHSDSSSFLPKLAISAVHARPRHENSVFQKGWSGGRICLYHIPEHKISHIQSSLTLLFNEKQMELKKVFLLL